ncbi:MAG: tRNA (cytidine(34)-2'-O)-methyltransferase [Pseudomonadota bacterium]
MRLVLYQPDIPQNCGTMMRLAACLALPVDIIEPCGFVLDDKRLRRAAMDYYEHLDLTRHRSWQAYCADHKSQNTRLVLLTTKGDQSYCDFSFRNGDRLLLGRESAGVPQEVHDLADARIRIPLKEGLRSINVAQAAAMVAGEALRQTGGFSRT